ncbi:MAG: InlB B-repeat-containing protein, partial [Acutalibacteraceae bacterium]
MTKAKKVVALLLAFLMIFGSVSVLASAWDVTVDDGTTLEIGTKFFKQVDGEWVETTKVRPGDVVKARVYLGTDYYSNDSTLLFFYDKDFFTHAYGTLNSLEVNDEAGSFAVVNGVSGLFSATPNLNSLVSNGYIDSAFLDDYGAFLVNVDLGDESNVMYDNSTWIFEFTLTVSDTASGSGDLFVKDTTIQNSTTQTNGKVSVPKGPADGTAADAYEMWLWDATPVLSSQPVSTLSSVTFNANTGVFADDTDTYVVEGQIDSAIDTSAIPAISKEGYTFLGWTDELGNDVPTPTEIPEDDLVLNAKWIKNVNITFNTDGGSEIPEITNVTPNTEFSKPENPTKAGYTFVGWDVRGGQLPDVYPETDTTYTAIWALDVTVSFDTLGGTVIAPMNGYAGESFDKEAVPAPTKEGHTFINWSPVLPEVFPDQSTTYTAVYETKTYPVRYFVNGTEVASSSIEFGSEIPTDIPVFDVPEGQQLSGWYTDESLSTPLAANATVSFDLLAKFGDGEDDYQIVLYATTSDKYFDAIFDANGGKFSDDSETKTVSAIYGTGIVAPEDPTRDHYEFLGWEPDSMIMDSEGKTFKAVWGIPTYTVKYYSDGALVEEFTIEAGQSVERPVNPYKTGYTFVGWTDVEGSTTPVTIPDVMPESDLTYYAIFAIRQYTITFKETGESVIDPITQDYNSAVVAPENPVKTGYTFMGWADKNGNIVGVPSTMPAKNTTLTAQWQINQYTITFADTGDSTIPAITQDYGTAITAPENPTKTGYTFDGWDTEIPATMPAGDMTITAKWTVNQYTITFDTDGGSEVAPITDDYG